MACLRGHKDERLTDASVVSPSSAASAASSSLSSSTFFVLSAPLKPQHHLGVGRLDRVPVTCCCGPLSHILRLWPSQGDWDTRAAAAIRAYHEWMPIRSATKTREYVGYKIYRSFQIGDLATLMLLESRLVNRTDPNAVPSVFETVAEVVGHSAPKEWAHNGVEVASPAFGACRARLCGGECVRRCWGCWSALRCLKGLEMVCLFVVEEPPGGIRHFTLAGVGPPIPRISLRGGGLS